MEGLNYSLKAIADKFGLVYNVIPSSCSWEAMDIKLHMFTYSEVDLYGKWNITHFTMVEEGDWWTIQNGSGVIFHEIRAGDKLRAWAMLMDIEENE